MFVDIASPPGGHLDLFNIYVALSHSLGRQAIRLLRKFDEKIFLQGHSAELLQEDNRLEELNEKTKMWWSKVQRE